MSNEKSRVATEVIRADVLPLRREGDPQVRLNLALDPSITTALRDYAQQNGITVTEAIRRATSLLDYFRQEVENVEGSTLAVVHENSTVQPVAFEWNNSNRRSS